MARCPNCSYELVLLQRRSKCKCALCGRLYPQKEVENREFRELNKRERTADIDNLKRECKERTSQMRKLGISLRHLFYGLPPDPKEYHKAYNMEYYRINKERIREKGQKIDRKRYKKDKDLILSQSKKHYRKNKEVIKLKNLARKERNPELNRIKVLLLDYRKRQKALALHYLINSNHNRPDDQTFHSVPAYALSYLLV